jgi:LPS sulfotransferase NodH
VPAVKNRRRWFARESIEPLRISYDDLSAGPVETLRHVLDHLGLGQAAADGVTPGVGKLADSASREWVARYRFAQ